MTNAAMKDLDAVQALCDWCRENEHHLPFELVYRAVAAVTRLREMAAEHERMHDELTRIMQEGRATFEALKAMVERDEKGGGAEGPARKKAREVLAHEKARHP